MKKDFLSFYSARKFVRTLGIKNNMAWRIFCKKSKLTNLLYKRFSIFKLKRKKDIFISSGNLFSGVKKFINFNSARRFCRLNKIKSYRDWRLFCRKHLRPADVPSDPRMVYKNRGWISWSDFLGTARSNRSVIKIS